MPEGLGRWNAYPPPSLLMGFVAVAPVSVDTLRHPLRTIHDGMPVGQAFAGAACTI